MANEIEKTGNPNQLAKFIDLAASTTPRLDALPPEKVAEIQEIHAKGMVEIAKTAAKTDVELAALRRTVDAINEGAIRAKESNVAFNVTHDHENASGKFKFVIANTGPAAAGLTGWSPLIVIVGVLVAAVVIIAVIAFRY